MAITMIGVLRADRPEHTPEAEAAVVDMETPGVLVLRLDDGLELTMDPSELLSAVAQATAA